MSNKPEVVDVEELERRNTPDCEWCGSDGSFTDHYDNCAMPIIRALAVENERLRAALGAIVAGSDDPDVRACARAAREGKDG